MQGVQTLMQAYIADATFEMKKFIDELAASGPATLIQNSELRRTRQKRIGQIDNASIDVLAAAWAEHLGTTQRNRQSRIRRGQRRLVARA